MSKECVRQGLLGAIHKLVWKDDITRLVHSLKRADGAHANDPRDAQLLHRVDVCSMIQFGRQNTMFARMSWQKDHLASGKLACEQLIRGASKRRFHLHPFLPAKAFDVI